jgi:hypothetical protein
VTTSGPGRPALFDGAAQAHAEAQGGENEALPWANAPGGDHPFAGMPC